MATGWFASLGVSPEGKIVKCVHYISKPQLISHDRIYADNLGAINGSKWLSIRL
jgi:hypothetical protein